MRRNALPRSERLRGKVRFSRLFAEGTTLVSANKSLRIIYLVDFSPLRPGIGFAPIVPKKTCPAVQRNRLKRLMRAAYRTHKHNLISLCFQKNIFISFVLLPGSYPKSSAFSFLEKAVPSVVPGFIQHFLDTLK